MSAWALRLLATAITALSMLGSTSYALAHPKNPNAPLQPPVANKPSPSPTPEPTPVPTLLVRTITPSTPSPTPSSSLPPSPRTGAGASASVVARATAAPTAPPRTASPRPTAIPTITLRAGVRATALPSITYTHVS